VDETVRHEVRENMLEAPTVDIDFTAEPEKEEDKGKEPDTKPAEQKEETGELNL